MANLTLTSLEIRNLISLYESELRKLNYQVAKTESTLNELRAQVNQSNIQLPEAPVEQVSSPPKKKRGRPKKSDSAPKPKSKRGPGRPRKSETQAVTEPKRGPGRPKKSDSAPKPKSKRGPGRPKKSSASNKSGKKKTRTRKKTGGYKLSDWDKFIINTIDKADKPLINSELLDSAANADLAKGMKEDDVKVKISQSIHKLANKRKTLAKTRYEGRGYAYATDKMTFNNGKLKKEYKR